MYERLLLESGKVFDGSRSGIGVNVIDDTQDFTVPVTGEGKAVIVQIVKPDNFTPGIAFVIHVQIRNVGWADELFAMITNIDTGVIIAEDIQFSPSGVDWAWHADITLLQTTDFHGRIDVGHVE